MIRMPLSLVLAGLVVGLGCDVFAQQPLNMITPPPEASSNVEVREHDLSAAIGRYVETSELSEKEARKQALIELFSPVGNTPHLKGFKETSPGKFQVTATPLFHSQLNGVAASMLHDGKQITIAAVILTVDEETMLSLRKNVRGWKFSQATTPAATDPAANRNKTPEHVAVPSAREFVAMQQTTQALPCRIASLTSKQRKTLLRALQSNTKTNILSAPKVTLFPEQSATIADTTQRPFVTSVTPVKNADGAVRDQPHILVLEEGTTMQLSVSILDNDDVRLAGAITFSEIEKVDEFTFERSPGVGVTVQLPKHYQRQVNLSKDIASGSGLLIDPHIVKETVRKRRFRSDKIDRTYTMILLQPTVIPGQTLTEPDGQLAAVGLK